MSANALTRSGGHDVLASLPKMLVAAMPECALAELHPSVPRSGVLCVLALAARAGFWCCFHRSPPFIRCQAQVPLLPAASPCSRDLPPVAILRRPVWTVDRVAFVQENVRLELTEGCLQSIPAPLRIPRVHPAALVQRRPAPVLIGSRYRSPAQLRQFLAAGMRTFPPALIPVVS